MKIILSAGEGDFRLFNRDIISGYFRIRIHVAAARARAPRTAPRIRT